MNEATKENLKHYGKEALKIGIAVAAGVAAYKLYETWNENRTDTAIESIPDNGGVSGAEFASIDSMF